uniref:Uncharacterized protein n=1 Tax=Glossina pallidipes TaxID=7398 RepID=A0A1A9ZP36_GLOPL
MVPPILHILYANITAIDIFISVNVQKKCSDQHNQLAALKTSQTDNSVFPSYATYSLRIKKCELYENKHQKCELCEHKNKKM